ncbi:MAG TPA: hypothetical protein VHM01_11165 [Alphaproteobacteria bacterium]|nr:hypothetical protein [Alphaproteobacteria bacterium]
MTASIKSLSFLFVFSFMAPTVSGAAIAQDRATLEMEVAREFLALELAGWRLPDPVESCLSELPLRRLEPTTFGNTEMIDQPELVDPPGPHARIVRIEPEGGDRRRRLARIEWLLAGAGGTPKAEPDSFVFVINDAAGDRGAASMVREPARLVVRRECFG